MLLFRGLYVNQPKTAAVKVMELSNFESFSILTEFDVQLSFAQSCRKNQCFKITHEVALNVTVNCLNIC